MRSNPKRWLAVTTLSAVAPLAAAAAWGPGPAWAGTAGPASISLRGHGFGHGRGMGQWGSLGYALAGDSYQWILGHYYGTTSMGTVSDEPIRVIMSENDANDVVATSPGPFSVAGTTVPAGGAARMHLLGSGQWELSTGPGCAGPWQVRADLAPAQAVAVPASESLQASASQVLALCVGGTSEALRGEIAAASYNGSPRTLNVLSLEAYLQGVVPSESPASWGRLGSQGRQGQPAGFQALEAQAVAARSYAVASMGQYGFADICDTQACQVYGGMAAEQPTSDLAVADTAGEVRTLPSGAVAATEYSASTGGYTAGGAFPAVPDDGDAVCLPQACNPNHDWTASVPVATIEADWPGVGQLRSVNVSARNGLGDLGGRVERLTLVGTGGDVGLSGSTFADTLGLASDWFAVLPSVASQATSAPASVTAPAPVVPADGGLAGYRVADAAGHVYQFGAANDHGSLAGRALPAPLVGAAAEPDGYGYWMVTAKGNVYPFGSSRFYGSTALAHLRRPIVAMDATPSGHGYWLVASDGGIFSFGDARFHGSTGAMRLAGPIVGMASTPDGGGYWLVASDGGIFSFGDARFHGSTGGIPLAGPIVGMASTPDGAGYWLLEANGRVFDFGDAAHLGSLPLSAGPAMGILATPAGQGYLILTRAGRVVAYGDAPYYGDVALLVPGYKGRTLGMVAIPD